MKFIKNFLLLTTLLAIVFGCEPLDEVYEELDDMKEVDGENSGISISYTLTADDYAMFAAELNKRGTVDDSTKANFVAQYEAFNATIEVSALLEDFVNESYPQLKKGAAVRVTYNMLEGETFEDASAEYVQALSYELDADDYESVSAEAGSFGFFDSEVDYNAAVSGVLNNRIQSPASGDIVAASFDKVDVAYSSLTGETVYTEGFETDIDAFETFDLEGDQSWGHGDSFGSTYAIMSGFSGGAFANKDWLVSPEIDLSNQNGEITLKMSQILNFQGAAEWGTHLRVVFATDYTGDVSTATWQDITFNSLPPGDEWDVYDNEADITAAGGEKIHLGFYYESTTDDAPNWRITNLVVEAGAAPETDLVNLFFEFDGSVWEEVSEEAIFLGSADYDAMGEESGQPGRFDNFSSSTPPEDYIPSFLSERFPFAQEK